MQAVISQTYDFHFQQLTAPGEHGVHGKHALLPAVVALKKETGQSLSQLSTMGLTVQEMIRKHNHAIVTGAQVIFN